MSDDLFGNVRTTIFRGDEALRIAVRRAPDGRSYVELAKYGAGEKKVAAIAVRLEELDEIAAGFRDARNVTLGHPRHDPKVNALDEIEKLKKAKP